MFPKHTTLTHHLERNEKSQIQSNTTANLLKTFTQNKKKKKRQQIYEKYFLKDTKQRMKRIKQKNKKNYGRKASI